MLRDAVAIETQPLILVFEYSEAVIINVCAHRCYGALGNQATGLSLLHLQGEDEISRIRRSGCTKEVFHFLTHSCLLWP